MRYSRMDAVVQPGAPASVIGLSKPSPISGATSNPGGLISGEHYRPDELVYRSQGPPPRTSGGAWTS